MTRLPVLALGAALLLSGCAVTPDPLSLESHAARAEGDIAALFSGQEQVTAPIPLESAMARAILYNLDHRLKVMENALANHQLTSANLSMLPSLTAEAGYTGRDNFSGSNSFSLTDNSESLASSTSSDRDLKTFDLTLTWNILDLGMSWVRANQQADRQLITQERRRKVIHNIIQDVRSAFWNAVSADRLLTKITPLMIRVKKALDNARKAQKSGVEEPLSALRYRRELLDTLRQLKVLRRELIPAKTRLAALMNLRPGSDYSLQAVNPSGDLPDFKVDVERLERLALLHRPELREEGYQDRISLNDVKLAYLDMVPGLELKTAWNVDSNSYVWEQTWFSWGNTITANLFDIFTGPQRIEAAEARTDVVKTRRLALSMAVISQVHVAVAGYSQAIGEFETADEMGDVEKDILKKVLANLRAGSGGERTAIRSELQALLAELRRDLAFATVRNAVGRVYVSIGADPFPDKIKGHDLVSISSALKEINARWFKGTFDLPEPQSVRKTDGGNTPVAAPSSGPEKVVLAQKDGDTEDVYFDLVTWIGSLFEDDNAPVQAAVPPPIQ